MIVFENVSKIYPGGFKALKNVNLKIDDGEFIAIIGRSGAGKSTLIRMINQMIDVSEGRLMVNDTDVSKLTGKDLRAFRREIGMIFQQFNLVDRTSVLKNVLAGFVPEMNFINSILGIYPKEMKLKSLEALRQVDILDKAYNRADQLSGGQQQRVALARTLAQNPSIILADEPVASLDPVTAKQVMDYFKKINEVNNIAILINIHHVDLALDYAKRVIGIKEGQIVYDGPAKDVDEKVLKLIYGEQKEEITLNKED